MKYLIPLAAIIAMPAFAETLPPAQNLDELEQIVVTTLGADIGQPGGPMAPIDRRMRLAACPTGIQIDAPQMGAVTVRCTTAGWRLRVPLARTQMTAPQQPQGFQKTALNNADVRKGDPVQLVAQGDSFSISVDGVAMEDANVGGRVRVTRGGKGSTMFAEVIEPGRVRLLGFK